MIAEPPSWDIQGDEMEGESGVTRINIDKLHSCVIKRDQMEAESMELLKVSLMNVILRISIAVKWKVKVVLLDL